MKRNNFFGVWHRCSICGTIFSDKIELREHLETHRPAPRVPLDESATAEEPQTELRSRLTHPKLGLAHKKYMDWGHKGQ